MLCLSIFLCSLGHQCIIVTEFNDNSAQQSPSQIGRLTFDTFDANRIMANSAHLLGSEGKEYNTDETLTGKTCDSECSLKELWNNVIDLIYFMSGVDTKERLARQRQQVNAQLGLDTMAALGMDTSNIVSEEDIISGSVNSIKTENKVTFPLLFF